MKKIFLTAMLVFTVIFMPFATAQTGNSTATAQKDNLIGMRFKDYQEEMAFQSKLGFFSGAQSFYGKDQKLRIERWENQKTKQLWLALVEESDNGESVICDVMKFSLNSIVDIGPFQVYNNRTKDYSDDYMMVQIDKEDKVVKIYDVDLTSKKIIAKNPESYWGKALTEWDSY